MICMLPSPLKSVSGSQYLGMQRVLTASIHLSLPLTQLTSCHLFCTFAIQICVRLNMWLPFVSSAGSCLCCCPCVYVRDEQGKQLRELEYASLAVLICKKTKNKTGMTEGKILNMSASVFILLAQSFVNKTDGDVGYTEQV